MLRIILLPGLQKKLCPFKNNQISLHEEIIFCKSKVERSFYFSYSTKPTLRLCVCTPRTNEALIQRDPSKLKVPLSHKTAFTVKYPPFCKSSVITPFFLRLYWSNHAGVTLHLQREQTQDPSVITAWIEQFKMVSFLFSRRLLLLTSTFFGCKNECQPT